MSGTVFSKTVLQTFGAIALSTLVSGCVLERTSITLTSDAGDYIGGGKKYDYSNKNALINTTENGGLFHLSISGNEWWYADFQMPAGHSQLEPGTYTQLTRYPFNDQSTGGLSWSGEGRGCNTLTGSMEIKKATYVSGKLTAVALTFEQHCEGGSAALHGTINWYANDTSKPAGPVKPIPQDLWQPDISNLPAQGSYIYLESQPGDYIGGGSNDLVSGAQEAVNASSNGNYLSVQGGGWYGDFKGMTSISKLQEGYYPDLQRFPFNNPTKGGLSWSGNGRGCNTLTGWFAVDHIEYDGDALAAVDLRFEQHCEGLMPPLNGKVHWHR